MRPVRSFRPSLSGSLLPSRVVPSALSGAPVFGPTSNALPAPHDPQVPIDPPSYDPTTPTQGGSD